MRNLEILYFEQLKTKVQDKYLENHTPSHHDISKWKGIDIVYFQEELLKKVKGSISEKTFYTYFKTSPVAKLPRIDMLNLLANYIDYESWYEYKKNNIIKGEFSEDPYESETISPNPLSEREIISSEKTEQSLASNFETPEVATANSNQVSEEKTAGQNQAKTSEKDILQTSATDNQNIKENNFSTEIIKTQEKPTFFIKKYLWLIISGLLSLIVLFLIFRDNWLTKQYQYSFIDADRNTRIKDELDVKIVKKDESPILFRVKPNESFIYTTKSKDLTMIVSSPFYKSDTIRRNLENAPESENIELKPNDYAIQLFYYSKSITDFKKKREQLNNLISDNALIYQVFDNDIYGVETLDKQKYISLVTLPSTALENLNVIDTQMKNGKIVMIKFKITPDEKND